MPLREQQGIISLWVVRSRPTKVVCTTVLTGDCPGLWPATTPSSEL